jgi:hypothetical protein
LKQAGKTTFCPEPDQGGEGNTFCGKPCTDAIRWIVYELRFGKVERGHMTGRHVLREGTGKAESIENETEPLYAARLCTFCTKSIPRINDRS